MGGLGPGPRNPSMVIIRQIRSGLGPGPRPGQEKTTIPVTEKNGGNVKFMNGNKKWGNGWGVGRGGTQGGPCVGESTA